MLLFSFIAVAAVLQSAELFSSVRFLRFSFACLARAIPEPWLSDLSDLSDTVGHCRTPVGR